MAKPGPKNKIDDAAKVEVYATLRAGGSLKDAADGLKVDYKTLYRAKRDNPEFAKGISQAENVGKMRLIKRVRKARAWQAAAWMLERKYYKEYGRKDRKEITGKGGGPIENVHKHEFDFDEFAQEIADVRREREQASGRVLSPDRN